MIHTVSIEIEGKELVLETGRMAKQANGSVLATYGGSMVLATACCGEEREGLDFVPLQVEYNEKYYAAGKIPGGFLKREGRPKDKEILVSRLIDRPMRPLFNKGFGRELQVVPTTISTDMTNPPDVIAMVAASAAVTVSDIPFEGPIGAVRIGALEGKLIVNPTFSQIAQSELDIVVAGTSEGITMVEGGGQEISEELMLKAIARAEEVIGQICSALQELDRKVGKTKLPIPQKDNNLSVPEEEILAFAEPLVKEAIFVPGKFERADAIAGAKLKAEERFAVSEWSEEEQKFFHSLMEGLEYRLVRATIIENRRRIDGRSLDEIRSITCEVGVLPRTHGSALFTRGETQALAITTLGTVFDEQMKDDIDGDKRYERFMLHYNFPPYSVGETGRLGTGRREIGHGHLAQRGLEAILPPKEKFPYTLRVVSEILESNGSSSMASVCGGTLSLLNAGVPILRPVAGIAMGLIKDGDGVAILSDILGEEDHLGDMDFKVAGTEKGITAFQLDLKISNISREIMADALAQAKRGRMHILGIMNETISTPSSTLSEYAPKVVSFQIEQEKIGGVIGPGGKVIKGISESTGANVNIDNDGTITIYSRDQASAKKAEDMIMAIISDPEVGHIYQGKVKRIMDFGAFVEFLPGKEGLVHISKIATERINAVGDVLKVDQEIPVKIIEIDRMGRINLSYIDALKDKGKG